MKTRIRCKLHNPITGGNLSKHEKIEDCLKRIKRSGRTKFFAEDIEKLIGVRMLEITRILVFTKGVDHFELTSKRPRIATWYFNGEPINVPKRGRN